MNRQKIGLLSGPLAFVLCAILPVPQGLTPEGMYVAATAALMAIWWSTEALPIPATALTPIVTFPLFGVLETQQVTLSYANHLVFLFMGGFLIAVTIERWGLHRRIALQTIMLTGSSPRRVILGFMLATAFLSMWISNTATAMLMVTIGIAIINQYRQANTETNDSFGTALMLSIAYSASIGGVATLIGTPPNAILAGVLESNFNIQIGFTDWIKFALPLSLLMLAICWLYLTRIIYRGTTAQHAPSKDYIQQEITKLGPMTRQQRQVLIVFCCVAIAWLSKGLFDVDILNRISDSTIAIVGALILFIIPTENKQQPFLLDWQTAKTIPWDILILFGGGFALANGFSESGLTSWVANQFSSLSTYPMVLVIGVITLSVIFLTELTSNTATASLLIPVVGAMAIAMDIHPLITMTAVTIAASYAFMLPVATPPNAIIFASQVVTIPQMMRAGLFLNLISATLITLFISYVLPVTLNLDKGP